jgi:hypothetical protein
LGLGHNISKDSVEKVILPKSIGRNSTVKVRTIPDSSRDILDAGEQAQSRILHFFDVFSQETIGLFS